MKTFIVKVFGVTKGTVTVPATGFENWTVRVAAMRRGAAVWNNGNTQGVAVVEQLTMI